jgi:hypothetical protein
MWLLLSCVFLALPLDSEGRDLTLNTNLSISGRYDDNVTFARTDPLGDYSSIVNPTLNLDYQTEQSKLNVGADVSFLNYLDQTDLDTIKHNYNFDSDTRISERLKFDTKFGYVRDTLLDSELEETGRVFNLENRDRYSAAMRLRSILTSLSTVGMTYNFYRTNYEQDTREDRDLNVVGVFYERLLNNGRDALSVNPAYGFRNSDTIESDTYYLSVGWTHRSTEKGTFNFIVGGSYTEESRQDLEKTDSSGWNADINYEIKSENSSFRTGYRRESLYDANDDLLDVDHLYALLGYRFSQRLRFNLSGNYYSTQSKLEGVDKNTSYFDVRPRLNYYLTEKHSLGLSYRFSQGYDDNEENKTVTRNQVELNFVFRFPKQL